MSKADPAHVRCVGRRSGPESQDRIHPLGPFRPIKASRQANREVTAVIYKFQSRATGDVLMTDEGAEQVLRAMGLAVSHQGVIEPENMPAAIEAIKAAVDLDDAAHELEGSLAVPRSVDPKDQTPTLLQRVWPSIDMLQRAHADGKAVVWGV
jgi:hypothetical protein